MDITLKDKNGAILHTAKKYCEDDINIKLDTQEVAIIPSKDEQIQEGLISKITVSGDSNFVPENIKDGVVMFGVEGEYIGLDTSDATAIESNLDSGVIAYTKDNKRLVGTTPLLNGSAKPYMLPQREDGKGISEILTCNKDVFYLVNDLSKGQTGDTVTILASQLPVSVENKTIFLRYSPTSDSGKMYLELYVAPANRSFGLRKSPNRVWCYDLSGNRANYSLYNIITSDFTIEEVTSSSWTDNGSMSTYTNSASGLNWYAYTTNDMTNTGGLEAGAVYNGHGNEDCIIKTTMDSAIKTLKLQYGGVLYTRINNSDLANVGGIKPEYIKKGITLFGVTGELAINSPIEYDEALQLSNAILTGADPAPYTQLEYIESTGTQYINTGYLPNGNSQYEMSYSNHASIGVLFGSYNTSWMDGSGLYADTIGDYQFWMHYLGDYNTGISSYNVSSADITMNRGSLTINGSNFTLANQTFQVNYPLYIFCGNMKGVIEQPISMRLHKFIIKEAGVVLHNYIPVIYNITGEIGLYDTISDGFIPNAGTGTFTAGPVLEEVE